MANLGERGPLDNPNQSDQHRAFQEYLEAHNRTTPRIRDDISPPKPVTSVEQQPSVSRAASAVEPPVIKRGEAGDVTINMAGLVVTYNEKDPAEAVLLPGRATDQVNEAARMLFRASVRLRLLPVDDVHRRMAGVARMDASTRLLELGRPDITLAARMLFDENIPGLPPKPVEPA